MTFICTAGDQYLCFYVQRPVEGILIKGFDRIAQAYAALWMGVMISQHVFEGGICSIGDPGRWGKIHVPLAEVDAIGREICSAGDAIDKREKETLIAPT